MSSRPAAGRGSAATLKLDFDRAFAAPALARAATEDLLAVRVAGMDYALSLAEIGGLEVDRPIVPLPGAAPELLGIAGLRSGLVAVYDLAALLGHGRSEGARWLALPAGQAGVGLAFEELESHLRVAREDVRPADSTAGPTESSPAGERQARGAVRVASTLRPLVDVAAVVATIRGLARAAGRPEER